MKLVISLSTSETLRAIASGFLATGLVLTVLRLSYRIWLRRFWVEDAWAMVALICGTTALTTCWTYVEEVSKEEALISFWIYSFSFPSAIWAVRESILFSIARIVFETQHLRRLFLSLGVLFFGMWAGLVAQKAWMYGHNTSWYHTTGMVHASMTQPMVLYELITDCLSDTILMVLPLRLLWSVKLPTRQRRMILAVFASSIIVSVVAIFRAACQIAKYNTVMPTATDFEMSSSLLVCNLLVVVTSLYRMFGFVDADDGASSSDDDDYTTRTTAQTTAPATTQNLTTIDLEEPGTASERTDLRIQGQEKYQ